MKLTLNGKEVNASIYNSVAIVKQKGYRCYHYPTTKTLGDEPDTRVFDNKEHAERFAWALQEELNLNVKTEKQFLDKNGELSYEQYKAVADEVYERTKL